MAMDKDVLGDAIVDRILTFSGNTLIPADDAKAREVWAAISDEIIKHIIAFAEVETTVTGTLPAGPEAAEGEGDVVA